MNKIIFVFLTLATCFFSSCLSDDPNNGNSSGNIVLTEAETMPYRGCTADSDCVYANNGCCDCANGGQDVSVNKTKLAEFEALFNCTNVACTLIGAVPACGSGTVSCKSGVCEYDK